MRRIKSDMYEKIMKVALPQIRCQLHDHAKLYDNDGACHNKPYGGKLHGNPYSLTLISIDGHPHSPLIRLVDVRLSPSFCLLYSTYSAISMAQAHVLRGS